MRMGYWVALVGALTAMSCKGGSDGSLSRDAAGTAGLRDTGAMAGMPMPGMQMMAGMRSHLDSMMGMPPEQMRAMMATHQDMMSRMMDGMGSDMRGMNMTATPAWNALADSVRQDLAELTNLEGQELSTRMQAHADRVRRLVAMHERMMGNSGSRRTATSTARHRAADGEKPEATPPLRARSA